MTNILGKPLQIWVIGTSVFSKPEDLNSKIEVKLSKVKRERGREREREGVLMN